MALKRLGQILIDLGLIDEQQLAVMLDEQSSRGGELIGKVGVSLGFFSDEQLGEALAEQWGTTFVTLYDREIPLDVVRLISEPMAQLYRVIPLALEGNRLTIASADPQKIPAVTSRASPGKINPKNRPVSAKMMISSNASPP